MSTDPLARRLHRIQAEIETLRGEGARVLYRLGVLLREVEDEELWRASPHPSMSDWLEAEAQVSRTSARRAITVARHFNEEIAVRYGLEKLYQGLRYLELTRKAEQPGDLIALDLRLRGPTGRFTTVPFHEATVRQIQDAIAVLEARRDAPPRIEAALDARVTALEAALPAVPAGVRAVDQRVEVQRAKNGAMTISFRQIPLDELEGFLEAVRAELLGP